jgi:hypothetical protein
MGDILLCAIQHYTRSAVAGDGTFMDAASTKTFLEKVVPKIVPNTLVITEGWNGISLPGSGEHRQMLRMFHPKLRPHLANCVLAGSEPRKRVGGGFKEVTDDLYTVYQWDKTSFRVGAIPTGLAEFVSMFSENGYEYSVTKPIPAYVEAALKRQQRSFRTFDAALIKAAQSKTEQYDLVVVVAGTTHILNMHLMTGWPVQICEYEDRDGWESRYRVHLQTYVLSI